MDKGASSSEDRAVVNGAASISAVPASVPNADKPRQLAEALARYLNPDAFDGRLKSRRNGEVAYRARQSAIKQARAAIRFFAQSNNHARLLATAQAIEAQRAEAGTGSVHERAGRQDAPNPDSTPKGDKG